MEVEVEAEPTIPGVLLAVVERVVAEHTVLTVRQTLAVAVVAVLSLLVSVMVVLQVVVVLLLLLTQLLLMLP